jgi:riboflavin kinase/FMN adenylyltransferase
MRIFRHYVEFPMEFRGGVVALGNFDGVHIGHQTVIGAARAVAREKRAAAGVMSFEPHPRMVFNPTQPSFRLTPFRPKARLIEKCGVDYLLMQHFDLAFAAHTAREFIESVLVKGLGVVHVVVGYDYVFGHRREGSVQAMKEMASAYGFGVTSIGPVTAEDGTVHSSSRIREALTGGLPREAARLLGRDWEIEGRVDHGDQRGRTIGFPTANIALGEYLHPAFGVYAVRAGIERGGSVDWMPGVANFGRRPTFDKDQPLLEVHLFDFDGDLYGRHMRVALVDFLRAERKFSGLDALKAQIEADCQAARHALAAGRA